MSDTEALEQSYPLRAVIYLRVSTSSQVNTDRDGEGFSIPAQREACIRKAEAMGAEVVEQYIDAGESATSASRPQLQAMLGRLTGERDIDLVIVHKVDRLARNRADDVEINLAITRAGARLVSVTENIDDTPSGMLMHGIMASIAEFYSSNLTAEIMKGMTQKVKKGGTPGRAPIGYLNVGEIVEGHEIRTVAVDSDRSDLIRWAFKAYASGDYSLMQLCDALQERGLVSRATRRTPAQPLSIKRIGTLLRNRFYVGLVVWNGAEYPGNHQPLIDPETFARVQAILDGRSPGSQKERVHNHYLKSSVYCARCGARLIFSRSKGRSRYYDYFVCADKHEGRNNCQLPSLQVAAVEQAVAEHYGRLTFTEVSVDRLRSLLHEVISERAAAAERQSRRDRIRITRLESERRKLLQAHLGGAVPLDLLREQQDRITRELADAGAALASTEVNVEEVKRRAEVALTLVGRLDVAYLASPPAARRQFNRAVFDRILVDVDGVRSSQLADPFAQLLADDLMTSLINETNHRSRRGDEVGGSREELLVGLRGFEPPTS